MGKSITFITTTHTLQIVAGSNFVYVKPTQDYCLGAWLLISVKTCSSDQTVTPLIKKGSNWRLRRQIYEDGSITNYFYKIGMLRSEDLTQWNIFEIMELDSYYPHLM